MNSKMNLLLKLEQAGQFLLSILLFSQLNFAWWVFPLCILFPDVSMIGYLFGNKTGAYIYNFFHHKLLAVIIFALGLWLDNSILSLAGIMLFGHSAMDRFFGYGFKFNDGFKHTHLGGIGSKNE
ncbi:DUF4260 domain-containing protein [Chryseobacterium taeanense]|uniref:DUF4260 domain-containing protein n=1 Tax=Chryseobacterium taeanense TaxID=311334 RepID=UPI0035B2B384